MAHNINIQFPTDETNPYWDGLEHNVDPEKLSLIENSTYWLLEGKDLSHNCDLTTLLQRVGGKFVKIPLDDYDDFLDNLLPQCELTAWPVDVLRDIKLGNPMTVADLREQLGKKVKTR